MIIGVTNIVHFQKYKKYSSESSDVHGQSWAALKQPWKGATIWCPKPRPATISLINLLKIKKRTSSNGYLIKEQ